LKLFFKTLLCITILTASVNAKIVKHKIKSGETLSGIAQKYKTTMSEIRKLNGLKKDQTIKFGKVIKVATHTSIPAQ